MPAVQMQKRVAFRNILFATDFSASANMAMPFAAGLAKAFGAKLFAMHVQEPANYALPPEMWQDVAQASEVEIQAVCQKVRHDFPEITPQVILGEGSVPLVGRAPGWTPPESA